MSSRHEQKDRLRRERGALEAEQDAARARRKRLGLVGGVVALAALVAVAVVVLASSSSGGDGGGSSPEAAAIPPPRETNLAEAARGAGCEVAKHPVEGREHTSEPVRYRRNPPTSGSHDPVAAQDGVYEIGNPPDVEQTVHALEHGRVTVQYRKGTSPAQVAQLETLAGEDVKGQPGYHVLLFENQTGMPPAVAATGWSQALTCPAINDRVWDALRTFRAAAVDKGPEFIP